MNLDVTFEKQFEDKKWDIQKRSLHYPNWMATISYPKSDF